MLAKSLINKMNTAERSYVRDGALMCSLFTGYTAYFHYRERIRKEFLRSEAYYRFSHLTENITPWK